jgi:Spy/CpxP family protein refolding chaperone
MRMGRANKGAMAGRGPGIAAARILRHAEQLQLSERQISQLEEISLEARKQMVDLRAAIEKRHLELEELLHSDSDDLTTIRKHLNALAEKRVDVQELKLRNWIEVKKILTEDQKEMIRKKHPRMGLILD